MSIIPSETICSKQGSKKHPVWKQNDIQREGSNKKQKQASPLSTKIYSIKLQILAIFGNPRNIIPSKIPCLMVYITIVIRLRYFSLHIGMEPNGGTTITSSSYVAICITTCWYSLITHKYFLKHS